MTNSDISVLIPCRNEVQYIEKAVDSILNQEYPYGEIEVIIIDGLSDDGTLEVIERLIHKDNRVKIVQNTAQTTPHAMNLGLKTAKYDLILRIDAHAFAGQDFLKNNYKAITKGSDIMCAGGRINNIYENNISEIIGYAMSCSFGVGNATFRVGGNEGFVDTVAFGVYKKEVFDKVGVFNEELIRNQDDELNFRITKQGYKILYDPAIQSFYYVRASVGKLYKQYYQYGYWKVYVNRMHKTLTSVRQIIPVLFVLGLVLGAVLSLLVTSFAYLYVSGILFYIVLALVFGIKTTKSFKKGGMTALIFPVLHWSYGLGYLNGLLSFAILNRKPSSSKKTLSRS